MKKGTRKAGQAKAAAAGNGPAPLVVVEDGARWEDHGLYQYRQHPGRRVLREFKGTKNGKPITVLREVYVFDTEEERDASAAFLLGERVRGPQAGNLAARLNEARAIVRPYAERIVKTGKTTATPFDHSQAKIDVGDGPAGYRVPAAVPAQVRDALQLLMMEQQLASLAGQERDEHLFCMGGIAAIMQLRASERELLSGKKARAGAAKGGKSKGDNAPQASRQKALQIAAAFKQACKDRPRLLFDATLNFARATLRKPRIALSTAYEILSKHPDIHEQMKAYRKKKFL